MFKRTVICMLSCCLSVPFLTSCDDSSGNPNEEKACPESCDSGYHCNESTGFKCIEDTTPGKQCPAEGCKDGWHCDVSTGFECIEDTQPGKQCPAEGCRDGWHCDASTGFECIEDTQPEKQCPAEGCEDGWHCNASTGFECVEDTRPEKQCPTEGCEDGWHCDASTGFECVEECPGACTIGDKACVDNDTSVINECVENPDGTCPIWKQTTCGELQHCNPEKNACMYACGDENSENCKPFSIILIPDTQGYTRDCGYDRECKAEENLYTRQMEWIRDNEKTENIKAAIHLGDITDDNQEVEWQLADYAHKKLEESTIPYTVSTGNHDYRGMLYSDNRPYCGLENSVYSRDRSLFETYFGMNRFEDKSWYHASPYPGNSYITFTAGELKFLILALEYAPRQDVICWANELIKKYPDHHVIVETHSYLASNVSKKNSDKALGSNGYVDSNSFNCGGKGYVSHGAGGFDLYQGLIARHSNIMMVVCGHVSDSEWRPKTANNGNIVTEMLVDYQDEAPSPCPNDSNSSCCLVKNSGNGWMRQLIFDPKTNTIQAKTFTVLKDKEFADNTPTFYCSYKNDPSAHNFSFPFDLTSPIEYKYSEGDSESYKYQGFAVRDINSYREGDQLNPAIAMHRTTGMMVAVWEDDSNSDDGKATADDKKNQNNHDIEGRIFYGGGCQKVAQFTVNSNKAGDQMTPAVAMDQKGNFVVVWADDTDGNGGYDIWMRGFDENGKERITPQKVHSTSDGQQVNPSIAMASNGHFVVTWEDQRSGGSPQIFMRGFDNSGKAIFNDRNVDNSEGARHQPSVGIADSGEFVVTWVDGIDENNNKIYAKEFKADGSDKKSMFQVNKLDGMHRNPTIGMNGDGAFYIVYEAYEEKEDGAHTDAKGDPVLYIRAHGYLANGNDRFADRSISNKGDGSIEPTLCVNSKGEALFAWIAKSRNENNKTYEYDIKRRAYLQNDLGTFDFETTIPAINAITEGQQDQPAMACTGAGQSVIIWRDDMDHNGDHEIYGRAFDEMVIFE